MKYENLRRIVSLANYSILFKKLEGPQCKNRFSACLVLSFFNIRVKYASVHIKIKYKSVIF